MKRVIIYSVFIAAMLYTGSNVSDAVISETAQETKDELVDNTSRKKRRHGVGGNAHGY